MVDAPKVMIQQMTRVAERRITQGENMKTVDWSQSRLIVVEAEAFIAGLECRWPDGWDDTIAEVEKESDPEFSEYQRLKKKFEREL